MSFKKKIELSVCIAILISIIFSIASFADTSESVRNQVLRLHVLANSDSAEDQELKLKVRDAILNAGCDIFDGSTDVNNARLKIEPYTDDLINVAEKVIIDNGFDYDVKIYLCNEYFTTRTYETVTLPAGEYLALKVIIGEGKGHNWWCVMFPPMCISAADEENEMKNVLNADEISLIKKNPSFEPRFKIIEIFESLKTKLSK